jgi:hypothetical protein
MNETADSHTKERPRERTDLDRKYGNIGISAVAAACRYRDAKTPAAPRLVPRDDESADATA